MRGIFFLLSFLVLLIAVGTVVWWSFLGQKTKEAVSVSPKQALSSPVVSSSPVAESSDGFGKLVQGRGLRMADLFDQISPKSLVIAGAVYQLGEKAITLRAENGDLGTYILSDTTLVTILIPEEKSWKRVGVNESGLQKGDKVELYIDLEEESSYRVALIQVVPF